jgi:predicted enzyme related to lactoylglutathione lyase
MSTQHVSKVINCIIPVIDVKESAEWYVKNLGCAYEGEIRDQDAFIRLPSGPDINLQQVDECVQWKLNGTAIPIIHFHTDNAPALHQHLKESGVIVEDIVDFGWIGYTFICYDSNGNPIKVWQANDLLEQ